jgi:hypothetical protein
MFNLILGMGLGGAAVWFGKDLITKWVMGAEAYAAKLQAKVNALKGP